MKRFALSLVWLAAGCLPALAHPHVWITASASALFDKAGNVIGVRNSWTMDTDYSALATEGLDRDGDGQFSEAELVPLSQENLEAMQEFEYFTYAYENGRKLPQGKAGNARQTMKDGKLTLIFDVPFATPVDPRKSAITYRVYDPTYFIEIVIESVSLTDAPQSCSTLAEAPAQDESALATLEMLADKPPDWQPPVEQDFGALFADTVKITCAP